MKKLIITILLFLFSIVSFSQTVNITQKKVDAIFKYYKADKISATDSVILYLPKDIWFSSLSDTRKHFKIHRIEYYKHICLKRKSNQKYLKGWVKRSLQ